MWHHQRSIGHVSVDSGNKLERVILHRTYFMSRRTLTSWWFRRECAFNTHRRVRAHTGKNISMFKDQIKKKRLQKGMHVLQRYDYVPLPGHLKTVYTQMRCRKMWHFIMAKYIKQTNLFENFDLYPQIMNNRPLHMMKNIRIWDPIDDTCVKCWPMW